MHKNIKITVNLDLEKDLDPIVKLDGVASLVANPPWCNSISRQNLRNPVKSFIIHNVIKL